MKLFRREGIFTLGVLLLLVGCQKSDRPALIPVTGTINFDGKPLADATVTFLPESGLVAVGSTDSEGKYSLKTQGETGATEGLFHVCISAFESGKQVSAEEFEKMSPAERAKRNKSRIPTKYANPDGAELTATVSKSGPNNFTFDLQK